jgi:hypothetical protein
MRGNYHNSQKVSLLITEVSKMNPEELNRLHGITIDPITKNVQDDVSGLTYNNVLEWANYIYEDEPIHGHEKIGKFYGFDDD